ncbi:MAG: peptide/nickel transport system substrate-binding protein [Candidatus Azotimanducaceae bacterium]|jgi:peptide/nickel transport system substrate-binding protein
MEQFSTGKKRPIFDRYFAYLERRKPSDRLFLYITLFVLAGSIAFTFLFVSDGHKITIATDGGTLVEGVIGTPRFANPILAITRADQDIVALLYSGLMRLSAEGLHEPDLAESVTVSVDGLVYNVVLKNNIQFHDGVPLKADDVAYTIGLIQDPALKSPLQGNWNDVVIEVISETELNFVLSEPYTPFIENLTVGILPKHVWSELSTEQLPFSQHNTEPIGSGPYLLKDVAHNKSGLIDSYILSAFPAEESPAKISNVILNFYPNEETLITAFDEGEISNSAAFSYETLNHIDTSKYTIIEHPLPRVFSVFLNQNKSAALRDESVRQALSVAIDRDALIETALYGHGVPTHTPIPPGFLEVESVDASSTPRSATTSADITYAQSLLTDGNWEQQDDGSWMKDIDDVPTKLSITITTVNTDVFIKTAEHIQSAWEALGVDVSVAIFEQSDLVQVIIRPRDYQALLFGTETGRGLDLYPFWHSSQKDDPGLNVALYTNISADKLLETIRTTRDEAEKISALRTFEDEIISETPAIFLYSPTFTYVTSNKVNAPQMKRIVRPSERFREIRIWHMNESSVWPFFAN